MIAAQLAEHLAAELIAHQEQIVSRAACARLGLDWVPTPMLAPLLACGPLRDGTVVLLEGRPLLQFLRPQCGVGRCGDHHRLSYTQAFRAL